MGEAARRARPDSSAASTRPTASSFRSATAGSSRSRSTRRRGAREPLSRPDDSRSDRGGRFALRSRRGRRGAARSPRCRCRSPRPTTPSVQTRVAVGVAERVRGRAAPSFSAATRAKRRRLRIACVGVGTVPATGVMRRVGLTPGDRLFSSGRLGMGAALAGVKLLGIEGVDVDEGSFRPPCRHRARARAPRDRERVHRHERRPLCGGRSARAPQSGGDRARRGPRVRCSRHAPRRCAVRWASGRSRCSRRCTASSSSSSASRRVGLMRSRRRRARSIGSPSRSVRSEKVEGLRVGRRARRRREDSKPLRRERWRREALRRRPREARPHALNHDATVGRRSSTVVPSRRRSRA